MLGATLKDIGSGGSDNFLGAANLLDARRKEAEQGQAVDAVAAMIGRPAGLAGGHGSDMLTGAGAGNPGEMGGMTPEMQQRVEILRKTRNMDGLLKLLDMQQQAQTPTYQQGPDGWYKLLRGLDPVRVSEFAKKERPTPEGMVRDATGKLVLEDGYLDAVGQLGERRRQVVVDNPTPSRARPSGGGGGGKSGGGKPWERNW